MTARHAPAESRWPGSAAADADTRAQNPDRKTEPDRQQRADVELGEPEPRLQRQSMQPVVLMELAARPAGPALAQQGAGALDRHQPTQNPEQQNVEQRDRQLDLTQPLEQSEQPHAEHRTGEPAQQQDETHLEVDGAAPPISD